MIKIAFSGPNHSGKTTTMTKLFDKLAGMSKDVIVFGENMHKLMQGKSIDDIRADPKLYLDIEWQCIEERIQFEAAIQKYENDKDVVALIDRPLSDSLYYLVAYTNTSLFGFEDLDKFKVLVEKTKAACEKYMLNQIVYVFNPLCIECTDFKYRPKNIKSVAQHDYDKMLDLAKIYSKHVSQIDLNYISQDNIVDKIISLNFES